MEKVTEGNFIFCSREIIEDRRLGLNQIKVLLALFSFRNKNTHLCFPSREAISKRTGIRVTTISNITTELVNYGWLQKEWDSKFQYYITVPDLSMVPESSTPPVPESGTKGVPESSTHNYKVTTKELNLIKPPTPVEIPDWLEMDVWDQFRIHRKHIKKQMSVYAEKLMLKKLGKAEQDGHDPNDLLRDAICAGWQGVVIPDKAVSKPQLKFPTSAERARAKTYEWMESEILKEENGNDEKQSHPDGISRIH